MQKHKLLIMGGTGDAAQLARTLTSRFSNQIEIVISYSGVTGHQPDLPCDVHVGGFGGAEGLITYLKDNAFTLIVDATHPFADKISQSIYVAAQALNIPALALHRPEWEQAPDDRWLMVGDMKTAARRVEELGVKTFLTIGIKELAEFDDMDDVEFLVRLVHHPKQPLPLKNYEVVLGTPPYDVENERRLLREQGVKMLVTKNSGGAQTYAKIEAARLEKVSVLVIQRPPLEPMESADSIDQVLDWLKIRMT